jgi:hypothetical protein
MWWNTSIIPATHEFEASSGKVRKTLSQKQNKNKRAGNVWLKGEHLPSKYEGFELNP